MPRIARVVAVDTPHHITQRGNNRQDVFFTDGDREFYLDGLRDQSDRYALRIMAFCLMTNHVHLVAIPTREDSLAKALGRTHYYHSRSINALHGRSGHLWQNRFYSCPLDEGHYWAAARYVERNPVRAKMVRRAEAYAWSSAKAHVDGKDPHGILDLTNWPGPWRGESWRETLQSVEEDVLLAQLRRSTHKGRPLGTDSFLSRLEAALGRRLRAAPVGRPKKDGVKQLPPARRRRRRRR